MAVDWSDNIVIANLADEPALSEELSSICERIEETKEGDPIPHAVFEFHEVSYVNSSNIAQLLRLRKNLDAHSRQLILSGVTDEVMSVLVITGLHKVFAFTPDLLTAIASIQIDEPDEPIDD
jgi:anti-anti-sigma factor